MTIRTRSVAATVAAFAVICGLAACTRKEEPETSKGVNYYTGSDFKGAGKAGGKRADKGEATQPATEAK